MKKVLVLEDNEQRVRWLARSFDVEAHWTPHVDEFFDMQRAYGPWDLVLLDHDLGTEGDGRDAARVLRSRAPIIVWSANPWGGPAMARILQRRGQPVVAQIPFGHPKLKPVLAWALD